MSADEVVVVLARPLDLGDKVQDVCRAWSRLGLLRSCFWLRPVGNVGAADGTCLHDDGSESDHRLSAFLASRQFRVVRLVTLRLLGHGTELDAVAVNREVDDVARFIEGLLSPGHQTLECVNLIAPSSESHEADIAHVRMSMAANVVISPEDRIDPRHADRLVTADDRFVDHAALALVANGGLWAGLPFAGEALISHHSSDLPSLRVTRAFARVLIGDDVLGAVVDDVTGAINEPLLIGAWTGSEVEKGDVAVSDEVVREHTGSGSPFNHVPAPSPQPQRPKGVGIIAALRQLASFIWSHLRGLPQRLVSEAVQGARSSVEDYVQGFTYGADSIYRVRVGGATDEDLEPVQLPDLAAEVLKRCHPRTVGGVPSESWEKARKALIELVDPAVKGAEPRHVLTDRTLVSPPGSFIPIFRGTPHPSLPKRVSELHDVDCHPCDPKLERELEKELQSGQAQLEAMLAASAEQGPREELMAAIEAVAAAHESLDRWSDPRSPSGTWKIGARLDDGRIEAEAALASAVAVVTAGRPAPDGDVEERTWRRVARSGIGAGAAGLVGVIAGVVWAVIFVLALPLAMLFWLGYSLRAIRRMFQAKYRMDMQWERYLAALEAVPHEAAEVVRLGTAYEQFLDWDLIVAALVHPAEPRSGESQVLDLSAIPKPAALTIASAEIDDLRQANLVARAGRRVFAPGWIERIYADSLERARKQVALSVGRDIGSFDGALFTGVHQKLIRSFLREDLESGEALERWKESVAEAVNASVAEQEIQSLFPIVDGPSGPESSEVFLGALTVDDQTHESFGLPFWTADGLAEHSLDVKASRVTGPVVLAETPDGADYLCVVTRLDVSDEVLANRLKLFAGTMAVDRVAPTLDRGDVG